MADRLDIDPSDVASHQSDALARRRRWPVAVLAVAIGIMAAAGLWVGQRLVGPGAPPGTVPLLRADTRPLKVPPSRPGGMEVPDQDMMVLNPGHAPGSKIEQLLPPPETPLPRPMPETPAPASDGNLAEATPAPAAVATPAPLPAGPPAAPPADAAAPGAAPVQAGPEAAPAAAPAAAPVSAASPASPAAASPGGYRLQLGALHSAEAAQQEWERLKRAHADLLGSLGFGTNRADLGERGIYYRILAGPIVDAAQAERVCAELKQRKLGCILVKP